MRRALHCATISRSSAPLQIPRKTESGFGNDFADLMETLLPNKSSEEFVTKGRVGQGDVI